MSCGRLNSDLTLQKGIERNKSKSSERSLYMKKLEFVTCRIIVAVLFVFTLQAGVVLADPIKERELQFEIKGKGVTGSMQMLKMPSGDADAPVLFSFEGSISEDGKDKEIIYRIYSRNNPPYYSVVYGNRDFGPNTQESFRMGHRLDFSGEMTHFLDKEYMDGTKGSQRIIKDSNGLIAEWALMDVVTTLPFDRNRVLEFNMLDMSAMSKREGRQMLYQGQFGKNKLHKFVRLNPDGEEEQSYWLNDQHQLIRVMDDHVSFLAASAQHRWTYESAVGFEGQAFVTNGETARMEVECGNGGGPNIALIAVPISQIIPKASEKFFHLTFVINGNSWREKYFCSVKALRCSSFSYPSIELIQALRQGQNVTVWFDKIRLATFSLKASNAAIAPLSSCLGPDIYN